MIIQTQGIEDARDEVNPLLPPGIYPGEIISSEFKLIDNAESKYNGVYMLNYAVKAQGDEYAATAFGTIFMPNPDVMKQNDIDRSLAQLKRLKIACGLELTEEVDDEEFMHCELQVEVSVKKGKGDYADSNTVRDVFPL